MIENESPENQEESAQAEEEKELTPVEHLEQARDKVQEAIDTLELGVYALQDSTPYFKELPELRKRKSMKAINDFLEKANFGITSLRDELQIALNQGKGEMKKLPKLDVPLESISNVEGDASSIDTEKLEHTHKMFQIGLQSILEKEVPIMQADNFIKARDFFGSVTENLQLRLEDRKEKGAA